MSDCVRRKHKSLAPSEVGVDVDVDVKDEVGDD